MTGLMGSNRRKAGTKMYDSICTKAEARGSNRKKTKMGKVVIIHKPPVYQSSQLVVTSFLLPWPTAIQGTIFV